MKLKDKRIDQNANINCELDCKHCSFEYGHGFFNTIYYEEDDVKESILKLKNYIEIMRYDLIGVDKDGEPIICWEDIHEEIDKIFGDFKDD